MVEIECKMCGEIKNHYAKGLCRTCYARKLREHTPVKIEKCVVCRRVMRMYVKKMCNSCYRKAAYIKNPDMLERDRKRQRYYQDATYVKHKKKKKRLCIIIKKHHEDMKDDPEALSTEFIQKIIGAKCEN